MEERFAVIEKSVTNHCCFVATVVDMEGKNFYGDPKIMCECLTVEDAHTIAGVLNI